MSTLLTAGSPETLNVLVAMVQFPPDNEPRTTGNGQFDLTTAPRHVIDPPPHDVSYVRSHMSFLSNYFAKVSDGKLFVQVTVHAVAAVYAVDVRTDWKARQRSLVSLFG